MILGVSKDSAKSHAKFREKECLPFELVSDTTGICESYGAWRQKKLYGREYEGIARISVLIDEEGCVRRVFDPVKPLGHAEEVIQALDAL